MRGESPQTPWRLQTNKARHRMRRVAVLDTGEAKCPAPDDSAASLAVFSGICDTNYTLHVLVRGKHIVRYELPLTVGSAGDILSQQDIHIQ
eukprot:scaffold517700_cov50-Prasinocladus_malaysianus.AAC.1